MPSKKFTVILLPDDDSYQVVFPHYPGCLTFGESVEEALSNAKEAIELHLQGEAEIGADPVPPNAYARHVVVGEIEAEVPESLLQPDTGPEKVSAAPVS
jgi:predicted RNase H-like HicB family nuclease